MALAAADALFTSTRDRSNAFVKRGVFYQSCNELKKAADSLQAGCDADPTNAMVRVWAGGACVRVCVCARARFVCVASLPTFTFAFTVLPLLQQRLTAASHPNTGPRLLLEMPAAGVRFFPFPFSCL